jgi:rhomboid protease GluP
MNTNHLLTPESLEPNLDVATHPAEDSHQPYGTQAQAPARPVQPDMHTPFATSAIIALNVLVWLAMTLAGGSTNPYVLLRFGAKVNLLIVEGQVWRLITPIFVHIGLVHMLFNTYAIYIFGSEIERFLGTARFLGIYMLSGIAGVLLSFVLNPQPAAGASGAIFGLIGTEAVFFYRYRNALGRHGQQRFYNILIVIGYNLAFTFTAPNIDIWGHLGGLLTGAALGWALVPRYAVMLTPQGPHMVDLNSPRRWGKIVLAATLVLVVCAWMAIALQAAGQ